MFEVINIGTTKTVSTESACNHVYVVDVSGSMYYDLPNVRSALKNIISLIGKEDDTFSLIWFSGRGQCGIVCENVLISDVTTVATIQQSIDRFIKPVGATGFVDPIKLALSLNLDSRKVGSLVMMTDGHDNCSTRAQIIEEASKLKERFGSVAFIEYGYYADRKTIAEMAEAANGIHIFADGVQKYEQVITGLVENVSRVGSVDVKVNKAAKDCIYVYNGSIRISPVVNGTATVPEDVDKIHSIVPKDVLSKQLSEDHLYLILYYAAKTENDKLVWDVLQVLGDVDLIRRYSNCFTKQELSDFESCAEQCVLYPEGRYRQGKDTTAVPNKNAPTIIDLLSALSSDEADAKLVTSSVYWDYKKIGRSRTQNNEFPRFVPSAMDGISMKGLVFSVDRPNVSIQTVVNGIVELPENVFGLMSVDSKITRNYAIVKDGIVNVSWLPVMLNVEVFERLRGQFKHKVIEQTADKVYAVFDLSGVPVVNRSQVESVNQEEFVSTIAANIACKNALKVIKHRLAELGTNTKTAGIESAYGVEAAKWLSSIGIRDYGFSPVGTTQDEASDEYEAIEVTVKVAGMSSIPAISAVNKKVSEGKKLNAADTLLKEYIDTYIDCDDVEILKTERSLYELSKQASEEQLARMVQSLVLGRKWFCEQSVFASDISIMGVATKMTAEKRRVMVKI